MITSSRDVLLALLEWTREMGVDEFVDDVAHDRLNAEKSPNQSFFAHYNEINDETAVIRTQKEEPLASPRSQLEKIQSNPTKGFSKIEPQFSPLLSIEKMLETTREKLKTVKNFEELKNSLDLFEGCSLKKTAKNICFYRGSLNAPLMIIGEAPGRDEDLKGIPFVGRAGQLLDRMLGAIGLEEKDVHITNVVYWRPPGNRTPTSQETEVCRPFLEKQISLVAPRVLLLLGSSAARLILRGDEGILRMRGRWFQTNLEGVKIPSLASLHPAYLLRTPAAKKFAWKDFLMVKERLSLKGM